MTKNRCNIGEIYWYLSLEEPCGRTKKARAAAKWRALSARERNDAFDRRHFEEDNYYPDPEDAKEEAMRRNETLHSEQEQQRKGKPEKRKQCVVENEKDIERYLVKKTSDKGWLPLKYSSGISTGYPDRCILLPGGVTVWVEVKTTGENPTRLQKVRLCQLKALGFMTAVVDSRKMVDQLIMKLQASPAS